MVRAAIDCDLHLKIMNVCCRCAALFTATALPLVSQPLPTDQIRTVAEEAYIYAYPLVLMDVTRETHAANGLGSNVLLHTRRFPVPDSRTVLRPNADTLYSFAWIDVSNEPVLLHVPDSNGRYYLVQFTDAWTETLFVPGKRSTGTGEGWFAVVGPRWSGKLPARARRIDSPTNMVSMVGRIQTNGAADYENVHAIQRGYALMPLSQYPDGPKPANASARARGLFSPLDCTATDGR